MKRGSFAVAAAFATERDASYAVRLISSATSGAEVRYTLRRVVGEDGEVQMFVLEASYRDPSLRGRLEIAMEGAHGIVVPTEALAVARAS